MSSRDQQANNIHHLIQDIHVNKVSDLSGNRPRQRIVVQQPIEKCHYDQQESNIHPLLQVFQVNKISDLSGNRSRQRFVVQIPKQARSIHLLHSQFLHCCLGDVTRY